MMGASRRPPLRAKTIPIVESDLVFLDQLQRALRAEGADLLIVTQPYSVAGAQRLTRLVFSAAVINDRYRRVLRSLRHMPVLLSGGTSTVPVQLDAIVDELKRLLGVQN
jgi:hypothetical protein